MNYSNEEIAEVILGKQRNEEELEFKTPRGFERGLLDEESGKRGESTPKSGRGRGRKESTGREKNKRQLVLTESFRKEEKESGKRKVRSPESQEEEENKKREKTEKREVRNPFARSTSTARTPEKVKEGKSGEEKGEMEDLGGKLDRILKGMEEEREERRREREEWERRWRETEERMSRQVEEVKRMVEMERRERREEEERRMREAEEESRKRESLEKIMEEKVREIEEKIRKGQGGKGEEEEKGQEEKERERKQWREMEWRIEEGERVSKRNNVVITGLNEDGWGKKEIENWIGGKLEIEVKIRRTWVIRGRAKNRIGVECADRDEKEKIMEAKKKLKGSEWFIDHDLTWMERRNREKVNAIAREWRKEGKQVKVGRNKLIVGDEEYIWKEREEKLFQRRKE